MRVALVMRPLVVEEDGERVSYKAGDVCARFADWPREAQVAAMEMERVEVLPPLEALTEMVEAYGFDVVPRRPKRASKPDA